MNHILDNTGYEQDILYRLGAAESETREIWRSTELAKGVSDSSWNHPLKNRGFHRLRLGHTKQYATAYIPAEAVGERCF